MARSFEKYKKELGKTCNTGFLTTVIALSVTPRLTDQSLSTQNYLALAFIALVFWFLGFILLSENEKEQEPKSVGKWKRIRVRKDTTIQVMEEAEG